MSLMDDGAFIAAWREIEEGAIAAISRGEREMSVRLSPIVWLALIEEIKRERPRNLSRLIADDHLNRLNAAIDRLEGEHAFLVGYGPRPTVASAFSGGVSDELRQQIQGKESPDA